MAKLPGANTFLESCISESWFNRVFIKDTIKIKALSTRFTYAHLWLFLYSMIAMVIHFTSSTLTTSCKRPLVQDTKFCLYETSHKRPPLLTFWVVACKVQRVKKNGKFHFSWENWRTNITSYIEVLYCFSTCTS